MELNFKLVGVRISEARKRCGMSQAALAEKIEKSTPYISYIENGTRGLSVETLVAVANALHVSADDLLQDVIVNTVRVSNHAFAEAVVDCSEYERRVLLDLVKAAKQSLSENRRFLD